MRDRRLAFGRGACVAGAVGVFAGAAQRVVAEVGGRFARRQGFAAGAAGDRARVAFDVGEVGEAQRAVAGVLDEDLVVDGLAEFARQGGGREAESPPADDFLQLFDREGGFRRRRFGIGPQGHRSAPRRSAHGRPQRRRRGRRTIVVAHALRVGIAVVKLHLDWF